MTFRLRADPCLEPAALIFFAPLHLVASSGGGGRVLFALKVAIYDVVPYENVACVLEELDVAADGIAPNFDPAPLIVEKDVRVNADVLDEAAATLDDLDTPTDPATSHLDEASVLTLDVADDPSSDGVEPRIAVHRDRSFDSGALESARLAGRYLHVVERLRPDRADAPPFFCVRHAPSNHHHRGHHCGCCSHAEKLHHLLPLISSDGLMLPSRSKRRMRAS